MAATEKSSPSSSSLLRPLSRSERLQKLALCLKRRSPATTTTPRKPSAAVLKPRKRKCSSCSPTTTHPGLFRCDAHRKLASEKLGIIRLRPKKRISGITTSDSGVNLRKTALVNCLAKIGTVEAERCRKYLKESMVKPSLRCFRRWCEFRPRPSRFCVLRNEQD